MKSKSKIELEEELGQWKQAISLKDHSLLLRLESSDTNLEFYLPNPQKEILVIARPNGFQLRSENGSNFRDFILLTSDIESIQLLPSHTLEKQPKIKIRYILASIISTVFIGVQYSEKSPFVFLYILLGTLIGLQLSDFYGQKFRQNLLITFVEASTKRKLLLTFKPEDRHKCEVFFEKFAFEKFSFQ